MVLHYSYTYDIIFVTKFCNTKHKLYRVYTKECCSFKSLQEIYFLPYKGTMYTVSSGNCSSSSCATSSSLLMRGHGASFQDGVTAEKGFLCAPF